jgi:hypothetical protein
MARRSPHASLATISHRNVIKKKLGVGGTGVRGAESASTTMVARAIIRARGERLAEQLAREVDERHLQSLAVDYQRWDPPPPRKGVVMGRPLKLIWDKLFPNAALDPVQSAWAAPYVTRITVCFPVGTAARCITFGNVDAGSEAFLVANVFGTYVTLIRCVVHVLPGHDNVPLHDSGGSYVIERPAARPPAGILSIKKPLSHVSALALFGEKLETCLSGVDVLVQAVPLIWDQRSSRSARLIGPAEELCRMTVVWRGRDGDDGPAAPKRQKREDIDDNADGRRDGVAPPSPDGGCGGGGPTCTCAHTGWAFMEIDMYVG